MPDSRSKNHPARSPKLKPLTPEQVLYQRVLSLRMRMIDELDLLLREYEATLPKPVRETFKLTPLINPETGLPFRKRAGGK